MGPADPAPRRRRGGADRPRGARLGRPQGLSAVPVARVDHQRRSQADRGDVHPARHGHAAARVHRRDHDALAAGVRVSRRRLPSARALRPDLFRPRHDHDLLRRHADRDRSHEFCGAAAARRARCRLPDAEFDKLLAHRDRRAAGQHLACRRRVRAHGLVALPALVRASLHPRRGCRLLPVGAPDLGRRHADDGNQLRHDDSQDPRARHELFAHDDVLLDRACRQPADHRGLSDPHRHLGNARPGPLSRLPLLHQRGRRQHDDVHQPHLGAGADVNAFFGIATSIIAVGTGVKVYNWLFTMYGGRIRFTTPMLWSMGFLVTFVIGGMTGVLLAVPPADFLLHNSLFLVAHFHNVIIGGVVFAAFAGVTYWFPKAFGFKLDEGWGKIAFWLSLLGFYVVFMPLYVAGLLGMTRRLQHYEVAAWRPWVLVAGIGIIIMICAAACQVAQFVVSIRRRDELRDETGDPWDGRSLEWATASPPPPFNFAVLPNVGGEEPYWGIKRRAIETQQLSPEPHYEPIEMPRNSPTGFITAFFCTMTGFALIWHIWWMVALGLVAAYAVFVWFAWRDVTEYSIPAEEVARFDRARRQARERWLAQHAGEPA